MTTVHRARFEQALDDVSDGGRVDLGGLFGPESASWFVAKEAAIFLGGGRAALLQLAHPYVAEAVRAHSITLENPTLRFHRTFTQVHAMIFGDAEAALVSARQVRQVHDGIYGTLSESLGPYRAGQRYSAHDEDALRWVWMTLIHGAIDTYARFVGPLPRATRDGYVRESTEFGALFGLTPSTLPQDWQSFETLWDDTLASDQLQVGQAAKRIGGFLCSAPPGVAAPIYRRYLRLTGGLMPRRFRGAFGFDDELRQRRVLKQAELALPLTIRRLPPRLRYLPAYVEARRRLRGLPPRDTIGRAMEDAALRLLAPRAA